MPETVKAVPTPSGEAIQLGPPGVVGRYRWVVCALLFFATTINYVDRQILALLKGILDQQIGWTNEQFGWVNSAFQLAYGFGLLGFGWFVDRFGTRLGYAVSIVAWSLSAAAHALVGSAGGFIAARLALGLGESGNFPSAIKAVALWFPKRERAFATSIFNAGTNSGALLAPAIIPWMAYTWGWRSCFIAAAVAGLLWLCLWLPFYEIPSRSRHVGAAELAYIRSDREEEPKKAPWLSLLGYRQTWSFIVGKFLTDPVWWFFLIWLPDFFLKAYGLDVRKSWIHLVTVYGIITVLSIWGGWLPGYLVKRGWSVTRARKWSMALFAVLVLPVYFATRFSGWPAVLLIALAGSAHQAWSANLFTTVSDMFPKWAVASVTGLGGLAGSAGGFFFPIYCGHFLDRFTRSGNEVGAYTRLLHLLAFAYVIAFVLHHLCAPTFEPVQLRQPRPER